MTPPGRVAASTTPALAQSRAPAPGHRRWTLSDQPRILLCDDAEDLLSLFFSGSEGVAPNRRSLPTRQRHDDAHPNSQVLAEHLTNAQLRIYPDAGHGFLNQYPELSVDDVHAFLET
jgi:pimeloyl-ACP methyl ester carboxylesterase